MLPPPTFFDRVIGGLPVFFVIWTSFITLLFVWFNGGNANIVVVLIVGFFAAVSRNARARVLAHLRWEREKAEAMGRPPPRGSRLHLVWLVPIWAFCGFFAFNFIAGIFPQIIMPVYNAIEALQTAIEIAYSLFLELLSFVQSGYSASLSLESDALLFLLLIFVVVAWRFYRRRTSKSAILAHAAADWKGTVRVMLPVPRKEVPPAVTSARRAFAAAMIAAATALYAAVAAGLEADMLLFFLFVVLLIPWRTYRRWTSSRRKGTMRPMLPEPQPNAPGQAPDA